MDISKKIASWQLPRLGVSPRYNSLPSFSVVFLCQMNRDERERILQKLCTVDDEWPDRPSGEMRRLVEVPWIRDVEPPVSVIFQMLEGSSYESSFIFVDKQSREDDKAILIASHGHPKSVEAARVPMNRANLTLSAATGKSLIEFIPDYEKVKIEIEGKSDNEDDSVFEIVDKLPAHLPQDLELEPSTLVLISLINLPDEVLEDMRGSITPSEDVSNVIIYNWPENQEPCSRREMYQIFQAIKPARQEDVDQTFVLFIDYNYDSDNFAVIVAEERNNRKRPQQLHNLPIQISRLSRKEDATRYWHAVWNPFEHGSKGARWSDTRVNTSIYNSDLRTFVFEYVSSPDHPAMCSECIVFILSPMLETELRRIRAEIFCDVESELQFVDVSHLIKTPDIPGLVSYFETEEFVSLGEKPPNIFLAIDRETVKATSGDDDDSDESSEPVIIASTDSLHLWIEDDGGEMYAMENLGYGYARSDVETAHNCVVNVNVGNMDSNEFYEPEHTYWSYFKSWVNENEDTNESHIIEALVCDPGKK